MYLSYGDRGDNVRKLQQSLINAGYDVGSTGADGIYGQRTQDAVRRYQQAQGIDSDGVFGEWTQGRLYGSSGSQQQEAPKAPSYKYDPSGDQQYQEALGRLQEAQKAQAPSYAGTYDKQLEEIYNKIVNRKDFSYDVNEDALYQQYKDQYTTLGKQAMQDTLGQAAALTGGYDSTYAQGAAQQQYDAYLQRLGDVVPDLYDKAYNRYQQEGTDMMQQYQMLGGLRDTEYNRYQDEYNRYMDNLQQLQQREGDLYNRGYTQWQNEQELSYERQQDAYQKAVNLITTLGYMPSAEELAAAGMTSDEAQRWLAYYQQQMAVAAGSGGGGGGGGGRGRGRGGGSKSGASEEDSTSERTSYPPTLKKRPGVIDEGGGGRSTEAGVDNARYKSIRDTVAQTAAAKGSAAAARQLLKYQKELSDRQLELIDAYYKSRAKK